MSDPKTPVEDQQEDKQEGKNEDEGYQGGTTTPGSDDQPPH